ncbi:MAG: hypothetical protein WCB90_01945 [Methanosarcina sp.]
MSVLRVKYWPAPFLVSSASFSKPFLNFSLYIIPIMDRLSLSIVSMILYSIEGSMTLWALRKEISRNEKMKKAEKRERYLVI